MGAGQSLHIEADQTLCPAKPIPDASGEGPCAFDDADQAPGDGVSPQLTRRFHVPLNSC